MVMYMNDDEQIEFITEEMNKYVLKHRLEVIRARQFLPPNDFAKWLVATDLSVINGLFDGLTEQMKMFDVRCQFVKFQGRYVLARLPDEEDTEKVVNFIKTLYNKPKENQPEEERVKIEVQ